MVVVVGVVVVVVVPVVAVVVATVVVVGVVVVAAAVAEVVGVVVVAASELVCWTKARQAASPAGLLLCLSLAVCDNVPSPYLLPLLRRNRKKLEEADHTPKSLS